MFTQCMAGIMGGHNSIWADLMETLYLHSKSSPNILVGLTRGSPNVHPMYDCYNGWSREQMGWLDGNSYGLP
jgi:hypothetical protein